MDDLPFQNLTIVQDKPKEEPLEVTDSLVPPSVTASVMASAIVDNAVEDTDGGLMEQELRLQREEEEYEKIYISLISKEEESNTDMTQCSWHSLCPRYTGEISATYASPS